MSTPRPQDDEDRTLYFAFGSNLSCEQMMERCPGARLVCPAALPGYRLAFAGSSATWGGGVATVQHAERSAVSGVIWSLTWDDLAALDRYEGSPTYYRRFVASVLADFDGGSHEVTVWAYRLPRPEAPPSEEYLSTLLEGYAEFSFDDGPLIDAAVRADREAKARVKRERLAAERAAASVPLSAAAWARRAPVTVVRSRKERRQ